MIESRKGNRHPQAWKVAGLMLCCVSTITVRERNRPSVAVI